MKKKIVSLIIHDSIDNSGLSIMKKSVVFNVSVEIRRCKRLHRPNQLKVQPLQGWQSHKVKKRQHKKTSFTVA